MSNTHKQWESMAQDMCIKCNKEWRCIASAGKRLCSGCYGEHLANESIERAIKKPVDPRED